LGSLFLLCVLLLRERVAMLLGVLATPIYLSFRRVNHANPRLELAVDAFCLAAIFLLYWPNRRRLLRSVVNDYPNELDFLALCCGVGGIVIAVVVSFGVSRWVEL
jgi:hypothetical protein